MKKIVILLIGLSFIFASGNKQFSFEKLSRLLKNKYNIHSIDDLNKLKSKKNKSFDNSINSARDMSDFIGEWRGVNQEMGMYITVGTDQSVMEIGSIMAMDSAEGGITVTHDDFETELNYILFGDILEGTNASMGSNNNINSSRDIETLILEFESIPDMNYARYGAAYTTDGEYVYAICGGGSESALNHGERYEPDSDSWEIFVEDLIPRRYTNAEYVDGYIYLFNGDTYTGSTYTDTVEIINVLTGEVTYSESHPYPVEYGGSAEWNGNIYLFGGSNGDGYSNRLYKFDPSDESWTQLADMPEAKQTSGKIVDGILYTFGGYNGEVSSSIHAYDIDQDFWITDLVEMPTGISAHSTVTNGDILLVVGDYVDIEFTGLYDPANNVFSVLDNGIEGRRHSSSVYLDGDFYIYGGAQPEGFNGNSEYTVLSSGERAFIIDDGAAGAFNFAQNYVNNYSSYWGEESFDLETEFDLIIEGSSVSGGLGGNDPEYCEINWPEDPYHIAVYSFVSEYVLYEGGSVGCFTEDFSLDQTYADAALEMEQWWTGDDDGGGGYDDGDADIIFMNFDFMTFFGIMFGVIPDSIDNPMMVGVNFEEAIVMAQVFDPALMFFGNLTDENLIFNSEEMSFSFNECALTDTLGNQGPALNGTIQPAMIELVAGVETEIPFPLIFDDFEEMPEMYLSFYNDSTGKEIIIDEVDEYYGGYYNQIDTSYFEWYTTSDSVFLNFENDDYYYYYDTSDGFDGMAYSIYGDTMTFTQEDDPCYGEYYYYYYGSYEDCISQYVVGVVDVEDFYQSFNMDFAYVGTVSVSEDENIIPLSMKLYPAYPNPFNPVATIQFDIAENYKSNTVLNIYDLSGRKVAELVNEKYNIGSYKVIWNASSFASGVYFTELISGSNRQTRKIILLK